MATRRRRKGETAALLKLIVFAWVASMVLAAVIWLVGEAEAHPVADVFVGVALAAVLAATGWLWWQRRQRAAGQARHLYQQQLAQAQQLGFYLQLSPGRFEHALAFLCERDGCRDVVVVGGAGDLGADVIATTPDGRRIVIQAKRYAPGNNVGSPEVQMVGGTYAVVHRAHLAAVVTTADYTRQARGYAAQAGIRLLAQRDLAAWASRTGPAPWH